MSAVYPPERRQLTVMLCDLVGYTPLSLSMDAEELADLIQYHRQRCTNAVMSNGGSIAQYVGDAVLAYFGYPQAHENDAERAIRAALRIVGEDASSQPGRARVHIGIATGAVVVGNLSAEINVTALPSQTPANQNEVSAVGSALNLAERLQSLAVPGAVVVSDRTRRLAGGIFEYRDAGRHHLKGFEDPIQAWEIISESGTESRFHALRAASLTPFVNRHVELQKLRSIWALAQEGRGHAVLLTSDAGIGKSRLAEMMASEVVGHSAIHLRYYGVPHLQSSPLAPVIRQLQHAAGFSEKDDRNSKLQKLANLLPDSLKDGGETVRLMANLLSLDSEDLYPPPRMSAQRQKQQLFKVLRHFLEAVAARQPVLLIVEDLHWIDPSTEELIGTVIDRLKDWRALAILTTRPDYTPPWGDAPHLVSMPLGPLNRNDSVAMIEAICGERPIAEATVGQIAERSDGVPLFIEDVTRSALELEDIEPMQSSATARRNPPLAIPTTLTDALMGRLDRLGAAKRIAQTASVIGRDFSHGIMARLVDMPDDELRGQLLRLVDSGILISSSSGPANYRFKHALVRDAAYSSLLKREQISLHSRIAHVLSDELPEIANAQPELIAYHCEAARDMDRAAQYLVKAAELFAKRSGFVEAIAQLEHALSLVESLPDARLRKRRELQIYLALGAINIEYRGFSAAEAGAAYAKALALCRELGNEPEIFSVLSGVGSFQITRANFAVCRELAEECLSRAALQSSKPPFVMGHRLLGGTLFLTGEFAAARGHLERALSIYEQDESLYRGTQVLYVQDHKSTGLCYLALTLTMMGYPDSGLKAAVDGLEHSRLLGDLHTVNFSLCYLAAVHHIQRDSKEALRRATESLDLAREQGFATWVGISQMIRGHALIESGRAADGLQEIMNGMKAHSGIEATAYQPFGISIIVKGLLAANKLEDAAAALARAIGVAEKTGECFYMAELLRLKGELLSRQGRPVEGEESLRQAISMAGQQGAKLLELRSATSLCRLLNASGKAAEALLMPVCGAFGEGAGSTDLQDAKALLS
ncbi:MAG TPA: AAA family ATPase [Burkholderiales bacterium]|nr:AAA family ATPase [Burkholderiales bacterium]